MKLLSNRRYFHQPFFWRNLYNSEIDNLEIYENKLDAYEIKWNPKRKLKPSSFLQIYPNATISRIDPTNYQEFLVRQP